MLYKNVIEGKFVDLCSVKEEDAEFTLAIRQDPKFNKFLPKLDNTLEQQQDWIKLQQEKQGDYFFVVWNKKHERVGTIGIYNIQGECAESGRLAMYGNAFQNVEAKLLLLQFGFYELNLKEIYSHIYANNTRVLHFAQQFGGEVYDPYEDKSGRLLCKSIIRVENFKPHESKVMKLLYR